MRRITPAGAGKTRSLSAILPRARDHPRRCGENQARIHARAQSAGSPPQVRGKPFRRGRAWQRTRITPAGAGKTTQYLLQRVCHEDHPRRCGENCAVGVYGSICRGSPPQVRGKLFFKSWLVNSFRITPAGAGKTSGCLIYRGSRKDHPRRCGENTKKIL